MYNCSILALVILFVLRIPSADAGSKTSCPTTRGEDLKSSIADDLLNKRASSYGLSDLQNDLDTFVLQYPIDDHIDALDKLIDTFNIAHLKFELRQIQEMMSGFSFWINLILGVLNPFGEVAELGLAFVKPLVTFFGSVAQNYDKTKKSVGSGSGLISALQSMRSDLDSVQQQRSQVVKNCIAQIKTSKNMKAAILQGRKLVQQMFLKAPSKRELFNYYARFAVTPKTGNRAMRFKTDIGGNAYSLYVSNAIGGLDACSVWQSIFDMNRGCLNPQNWPFPRYLSISIFDYAGAPTTFYQCDGGSSSHNVPGDGATWRPKSPKKIGTGTFQLGSSNPCITPTIAGAATKFWFYERPTKKRTCPQLASSGAVVVHG